MLRSALPRASPPPLHSCSRHLALVVFVGADPERDVPRRFRQRVLRPAKVNRALVLPVLAQAQKQMFLLQDLRSHSRFDLSAQKERLRVAVAERLQQLVPAE